MKDLEKKLDSMIVEGLIKEAEQDNADFEYAMSKISEEDFDEIVRVPEYADECGYDRVSADYAMRPFLLSCCSFQEKTDERDEADADINAAAFGFEHRRKTHAVLKTKKRFSIKPWVYSVSAAAAIIVCVIVPAYNVMNNKLCDSALIASSSYMSTSYMTSAKDGFDVNTATVDQVKAQLTFLEKNYDQAAQDEDRRKAGWILAQAYLKLHKKGDAVKVLKELNEKFGKGSFNQFGNPYQKLLDILD